MTKPEVRCVSAALADLEVRGFDRAQTLGGLRRLRNRVVDLDGSKGEGSESKGRAIVPSSSKNAVRNSLAGGC
jgi:hypothetical protein